MGEDCEKEHEGRLRAKLQLSTEDLILLEAANYLESGDVWYQDKLFVLHPGLPRLPELRVCAIGAIGASIPGPTRSRNAIGLLNSPNGLPEVAHRAIHQLLNYINYTDNNKWIHVAAWNDHHTRTKQQVIDALRAAATLMLPDRNT